MEVVVFIKKVSKFYIFNCYFSFYIIQPYTYNIIYFFALFTKTQSRQSYDDFNNEKCSLFKLF